MLGSSASQTNHFPPQIACYPQTPGHWKSSNRGLDNVLVPIESFSPTDIVFVLTSLSDGAEVQVWFLLHTVGVQSGRQAPVQQSLFESEPLSPSEIKPGVQNLPELGIQESIEKRVDGGVGEQDPEEKVPDPGSDGERVGRPQHGHDRVGEPADGQHGDQQPQTPGCLLVLPHQQLLHQVVTLFAHRQGASSRPCTG